MAPDKDHWSQLVFEADEDRYAIIKLLEKRHPQGWSPGPRSSWPFMTAGKGWELALKAATVFARNPKYKQVGLVLDADDNPAARWQSVRDHFEKVGVDLPKSATNEIFRGKTPGQSIGIWLMPDATSEGALESFLLPMVPAGAPLWDWSAEIVAEAQRRGAGLRSRDLLKSRFHSWLAWQKERPGMPFGLAIQSDVLDSRVPSQTVDRFIAWFAKLFPLDSSQN